MRDIKGYEGLYAITSCGKVWSYRSQKFLKPVISKSTKYAYVSLYKNNEKNTHNIHRLVAEAYIPNPDNKPLVNHIDEVRVHNWVGNLEWATYTENNNHGTRNEKLSKSKQKKVFCVELDRVYESITMAAQELDVCYTSIGCCCKGKLKTAGGYHWRYVE